MQIANLERELAATRDEKNQLFIALENREAAIGQARLPIEEALNMQNQTDAKALREVLGTVFGMLKPDLAVAKVIREEKNRMVEEEKLVGTRWAKFLEKENLAKPLIQGKQGADKNREPISNEEREVILNSSCLEGAPSDSPTDGQTQYRQLSKTPNGSDGTIHCSRQRTKFPKNPSDEVSNAKAEIKGSAKDDIETVPEESTTSVPVNKAQ
jgi:hypothetical protein